MPPVPLSASAIRPPAPPAPPREPVRRPGNAFRKEIPRAEGSPFPLKTSYICPVDRLDNDIEYVPGVGEARAKPSTGSWGSVRSATCSATSRSATSTARASTASPRSPTRPGSPTSSSGPASWAWPMPAKGAGAASPSRCRTLRHGRAGLVPGHQVDRETHREGREYLIFGRPGFYRGMLSMAHPELETVEQALSRRPESGMQGIYPSTEKLSNLLGAKGMYQIVCKLWPLIRDAIEDPLHRTLPHPLRCCCAARGLLQHPLPAVAGAAAPGPVPAQFDELLGVSSTSRRAHGTSHAAGRLLFPKVGETFNTFYREQLPFPLTGAQKRVIREIRQDTVTGFQMNRLLQGRRRQRQDLVALMSMLLAVDSMIPGLHDGPHGDPRAPAPGHHPPHARPHGGPRSRAHRRLEDGRAPRSPRRHRLGRGPDPHRHARPDRGPRAVREPRARGHRRTAPLLASSSVPGCGPRTPARPISS